MKRLLLLSLMFVTTCPMQKIKQIIPKQLPIKKFPLKTVTTVLFVYSGWQVKNAIKRDMKEKK